MPAYWLTLKKYWVFFTFVAILLVGAELRLYGLGENSFVADEFLDINSSYGFSQTGEWKSWDFNYGEPASQNINDARDERAAAYKWQVAQLFRFLPATEGTARLVSALWGIATIAFIFFAGWFYTGRKAVGLLAAFLFAVSVSGLEFDRKLRMYAMFLPVYLLFTTALFAAFERPYRGRLNALGRIWDRYGINPVFLFFAVILGFLSYQVHQLTIAIIPVFGIYLAIQAYLRYRKGEKMTKYSVLAGGGVAVLIAGLLSGVAWQKINEYFLFFDDHYSYLGYVFRDFAHPVLAVLLMGAGLWTLWTVLKGRSEALWLGLNFAVPLLMAIFLWRRNAGPQYIFFIQSFTLLLTAIGIWGILSFIRTELSRFKYAPLLGLAALLLIVPAYGYFLEENNTYHETSTSSNPQYRKAFSYFKKHREAGDVLITRNFRNFYWQGAEVPVYDFGGELSEKNFSLAELEAIRAEHPHGWVIISGNDRDYISGEAEKAIEATMEHIDSSQIRGDIEAYRW